MPSASCVFPGTSIDSIPMNRFVSTANNGIGSSWTFSSNTAAQPDSSPTITATTNVIVTSAFKANAESKAY